MQSLSRGVPKPLHSSRRDHQGGAQILKGNNNSGIAVAAIGCRFANHGEADSEAEHDAVHRNIDFAEHIGRIHLQLRSLGLAEIDHPRRLGALLHLGAL